MVNIESFIKNIVYKNDNLSIYDKESIEVVISKFVGLFDKLGVEIPIEDISHLFSTLKIKKIYYPNSNEDKIYYYDINQNAIIHNKTNDKDDDKRFYEYLHAMLDLLSKRYNGENYSDGLIYEDEYGNKFGTKINAKLKHTLITLLTGEVIDEEKIKDFYVDKVDDPCTLEDRLLIDINTFISTKDLLTYFINADGISFYQSICSVLNESEKMAKDFLSNIDQYTRENSVNRRKIYDEFIKLANEHRLQQDNSRKYA